MRIAYLVNSRWPRLRGAEKLLLGLLAHGRSLGFEVSVIAPAASAIHEACRAAGIRSDEADFKLNPSSIGTLRRLMDELRPDIVQGMSIFPVAFVRRLGLVPDAARVSFFAYVSTDPTSTLPIAASRFQRPLLWLRNTVSRSEAPRLDALFVASSTVAEHLREARILGHTVPIPGRIDLARLEAASHSPLDLPPGRPRIGYAGFLEPLKGIDELVVAFAQVLPAHPEARLLVAGDGPERDRLLELARSLGAGDRVTLLGFIDPVAPLLAKLDVFVSPSHSEGIGTSILEAMAFGVPCVCADSGGPSEFISDGVSGLLVPAGDPSALSAAISHMLDHPAETERIAAHGRSVALAPPYLLSSTLETVFAEYARAQRLPSDAG